MALDPTQWINIQQFTQLEPGADVDAVTWNNQWMAIVLLANHTEDAVQWIRDHIVNTDQMQETLDAVQDAKDAETSAWSAVASVNTARDAAVASATAANASKIAAAGSVTSADAYADAAAESAQEAAASAVDATELVTAAAASATAAASSVTTAQGYATAANTSKTNAATSATNAHTSEVNAANSATAAATSATQAANSATATVGAYNDMKSYTDAAAGSATAAANSADDAANTAAELEQQIEMGGFIAASQKGVASGICDLDINGLVPISRIPAQAKGMTVVNTIAERNALIVYPNLNVFVKDATGDPTVTSGGANYLWDGSVWVKTAETESMDLILQWANIQGKPTTFTPAAHRQDWNTLDNVPTTFAPAAHNQVWSTITNTPATYPPADHSHVDLMTDSYPEVNKTGEGIKAYYYTDSALNFGDLVYIKSTGNVALAKHSVITTGIGIALCLQDGAAVGSLPLFLKIGFARKDTWTWTVGGLIYGSITGTTGNTLTQTAPTASANAIQVLGIAVSSNVIFFNPNLMVMELT